MKKPLAHRVRPIEPAAYPDLDNELFINSGEVETPNGAGARQEEMMERLLSHFHESMLGNEFLQVFDFCSIPHFERKVTQEATLNAYLVNNIELLSSFDLNLV